MMPAGASKRAGRVPGGTRTWKSRIRSMVAAAVLAGGALVFAGCAAVRNELGTTNSDCYIAIPAAAAAVHHHGHLRGVRLVTVASLRRHGGPLYQAAVTAPKPKVSQVCLVAFSGNFAASQVSHPVGKPAGHLAIVELSYPGRRFLATLVITHPPLTFGHPRI